MSVRVTPGLAAALLLLLPAGPVVAADASRAAAATVAAFNTALTERSLDKAIAYLLNGGVQFNLQPAHTGLGAPPGISSDLRGHWSTIAPVLFSATKAYRRQAEVLDARAENGMATVWTRTVTETVRPDKPGTSTATFIEVYLLVLKDNQWKIGAIADSRKPNDVGLGGGQP